MSRNIPQTFISKASFQPSNIPRPPPPQINRTLFQERVVDQSIIGKLFLLCIEGKVSAIKDFILQNGLTVNDMVDTTGDSILHKILQNENLSKRDKIELFRFLKEKNLLKMSYNSNQTTPLHLAVKTQIPEIVKILLEAGHNPNNLDMNNKSPLFYAVSGETVECPKKNKKELLDKTKFKLEKSDTYLIIKELIKIINGQPKIQNLFTHIGNTAANLDTIFSGDINTVFEKDNKKVIDILTSNDSEDVKINKIFNAVNETKMSIAKLLLNNKLDLALKPNTFQPNTQNGWGPDNNPKNKIMKVNFDFKNTLILNMRAKMTKIFSQLDNNSSNLITKMNIIDNLYIKSIDRLLNRLNYQYQILQIYSTLVDGAGVLQSNIPNAALIVPITNQQYIDIFTYEALYRTGRETFESREIGKTSGYDLSGNRIIEVNNLGVRTLTLIPPTELELNETPKHGSFTYEKLDEKVDKTFKERNTIRDMLNDINTNNPFLGPHIATNPLGEINNSKFYIRKLKMIMREIRKLLVVLDNNKKIIDAEFNKQFDSINFNVIFDSTVQIQYILLSVANYLPLLNAEIVNINTKNLELKEFLQNVCTQIVLGGTITITTVPPKTHKIDTYFKDFQMNLDSILQNFDQLKVKQTIDDTYVLLNETYNSINNTIDIINESCSIKYINKYFNEFVDFDRFFNTSNTSDIDNMFESSISRFNSLPSKYDDLQKILSNNNEQNKKLFIEQYLYQIHQNSYFSYYDGTKTVQLPTIGFLYKPSINLLSVTHPTIPTLTYGVKSTIPALLNDAVVTDVQGVYGIKTPIRPDKKDSVIPIIGSNLSEHIKIIKFYILRYILQNTFNILEAKIKNTPIPAKLQSYADLIFGLYDKTKTTLGLDVNDKSVILIIIATCVDKLLNSNIESLIVSGINRFAYKTNRTAEFEIILNLLKQLKVNLGLLLSLGSEKFDIEHYMRDNTFLVEDTTKLISNILKDSTSEYIYSYAEDIFDKKSIEKNEMNIKKRYSRNILDNDPPTCYTINYEIIDLLIDFRADVSIKDKEGSTVIFTALDMNDPDIIKKFVKLLPVYNKHSKNLFGVRPYDRSLEQLNYYYTMFMDKNIMTDLIEMSQNMIMKKTQIQSEMRYHREIYTMMEILLNHYFYSIGKQYINGWSQQEQKELDQILNMGKYQIPLLNTLSKLQSTDKNSYLQNVIGDNMNTNTKTKQKADDIQRQIDNLNLEKADPKTKKSRNIIIDETIGNLRLELTNINVPQLDINNKSLEKSKQKLNIGLKVNIDEIKRRIKNLQLKSDIIPMYESIQSNIINNGGVSLNDDLKTYMLLWKESIKNNDNDSIMIIKNISNYISKYNTLENLPNITILQSYLDKVLSKLAQDYNELEYNYNGDNYVLNSVINIIKHTLSHTVGINLMNIIQKVLREELRIKFPYDVNTYQTELSHTKIIDEKIKQILVSSNVKGIKLDTYIMNTLIEKIIKINLNLYEDSYDKDNIGDISSAFNYIIKLLESNAIIKLDETSLMIKELREKIFPYFKDYTETNLKLIKKFVDGYMNSIINYSNVLNIYKLVLEKAQKETI
jgi:hypothetical protein